MQAVLQDQPLPARLVPWPQAEPTTLARCLLLDVGTLLRRLPRVKMGRRVGRRVGRHRGPRTGGFTGMNPAVQESGRDAATRSSPARVFNQIAHHARHLGWIARH